MAARASEMIVLINNGPNNTACRRTRKDTGQKDSVEFHNNFGGSGVCLQTAGRKNPRLGFKNPAMQICNLLENKANYKMTDKLRHIEAFKISLLVYE